jgi:hypothetical protein
MGKDLGRVMQSELFHEQLPLWFFYVMTVVIILLSTLSGSRLGRYIRRRKKGETEAPIGAIVGSMLGLLAFILAFTFGLSASRFDARKQLLLDEVNAIGTAFLRTDFLPEPQGTETRKLLRRYVDIRTEIVRHPEKLRQALVDSEMLHDQLWSQVTALSKQNNNAILLGLYIQSLNDVIDFHSKRVTVALGYRIPDTIWLALYFVTILAMVAVGYHFGITGAGSFWITLVLAFAFSAVILLIEDLDRSTEGLLKVNQKPMIELQQKLSTSAK